MLHSKMETINLNHLRYFYFVARHGSYTAASKALNIQQPALSKTIKALEEDLGIQLFVKEGRGIRMTRESEYIFARCDEIFGQVRQIVDYATDSDIPLKQTISVVANDAVASCLMPSVFEDLSREFPGVRPFVVTGPSQVVVKNIRRKDSSIGFFFHLPKLDDSLYVKKRVPVKFHLVIASKYLNSSRVCSSFIGSREVDNRANLKFPTVEKMRKVWPGAQIRYSTNSFLTHKALVQKGLGVSVLPEFLVQEEIRKGEFSTLLKGEDFVFDMKVVARRGAGRDSVSDFLYKGILDLL